MLAEGISLVFPVSSERSFTRPAVVLSTSNTGSKVAVEHFVKECSKSNRMPRMKDHIVNSPDDTDQCEYFPERTTVGGGGLDRWPRE